MAKPGRPRKYETPAELEAGIEDYFDWCVENDQLSTVPGLCFHLGFNDRDALSQIARRHAEFEGVVKRAGQRIAHDKITGAMKNKLNVAAVIFYLKNFHGWQDRVDIISEYRTQIEIPDDMREAIERVAEAMLLPQ